MSDKPAMNKPDRHGIVRLLDATRYSMRGFRAAWQHEEGFRIEACLMLLMAPLAAIIAASAVEFALMIISCALVVLAELINSAIEAVVDRIGPDRHPLSGQAKDLGSAAVFVCLMLVLVVWGTIIASRLWPGLV